MVTQVRKPKRRLFSVERAQARQCAGAAVQSAIKRGLLPPAKTQKCCKCGASAVAYHHHLGYAPEHRLDVQALCRACHSQAHEDQRQSLRSHPDWLTVREATQCLPYAYGTLEILMSTRSDWGETKHDPCGWTASPQWIANCRKHAQWSHKWSPERHQRFEARKAAKKATLQEASA